MVLVSLKRKETLKNAGAKYYLKNRESLLQGMRDYYKNHKEERREYHKGWEEKNRQHIRDYINRRRNEIKHQVIEHYGGKCACCGETIFEFLTIDHIDGYKEGPRKGEKLYRFLIKLKYPEGYQVLCWNCNIAKGLFGECPHVRNKR